MIGALLVLVLFVVVLHAIATKETLRAILTQQHSMEARLMSTVNDLKALVTALDTETNAVAAKLDAQIALIQQLKDQIANGSPVSQADLDAVVAGLQPISDRLTTLGADPNQPIPPA